MLRILVALPFLLLLVLFALSNTRTVPLGLWPTDLQFELPLALAILVAAGIAFLLGAMVLWVSAVAARLRARRAEHGVRVLEARVAELQAELARVPEVAKRAAATDAVPALQTWRG
jgi:uncharacterized integral membrane protein